MSKKTILIVEDNVSIREEIVELLEEEGYLAKGIENGQEAMKYLKTTNTLPTLILLDLMMPIMNGWQFRIEQEQDLRLSKIPVIVVTADGHAEQKAAKMNATGWLKKPIDIDTLLKTIQTFSA